MANCPSFLLMANARSQLLRRCRCRHCCLLSLFFSIIITGQMDRANQCTWPSSSKWLLFFITKRLAHTGFLQRAGSTFQHSRVKSAETDDTTPCQICTTQLQRHVAPWTAWY